jgi:hypothetical protein
MENLRIIIRDLQDRLGAVERYLEGSGYVSPEAEKRRHMKALAQLRADYDDDLNHATSKEARGKARDAYNAAVEVENARHAKFFEIPDTTDCA